MGRGNHHRICGLLVVSGVMCWPAAGAAQRPRFSVGAPIAIAAGDPGPQAVAVGDLNKDGRLDIVVVSADEDAGPIALLLNQRNGTFAPPSFVADEDGVLGDPVAVAVADVGAPAGGPDGNNDIVVVDADGGFLVVFGDGAGHFTIEGDLQEFAELDVPVGVAVADFDGHDGPDLAIIDPEGAQADGNVFFLCNVGQAGIFNRCTTPAVSSGGEEPIDIGTGDFNDDGRTDVVVLNQGSIAGGGTVELIIGEGDGNFGLPARWTFSVANQPRDLVVANLNPAEDSIDDVAVAEFEVLSEDNVSLLFGGSSAAFVRRGKALLEVATTAIAAGKLTNDDNPDFAGGNDPSQAGSSILTLAVGDGTGGFQDPLIGSLLPRGARALVAGRLNGDDLDDLVALSLDATELRIALNTFDPSTPTLTSTATQVPTRTATATPSSSTTVTSLPTATGAPTSAPINDDDSCSIVTGDAPAGRSWLPLLAGAAAVVFRRRLRRRGRRCPKNVIDNSAALEFD